MGKQLRCWSWIGLMLWAISSSALCAGKPTFLEQDFVLTPAQQQSLVTQALDGSGDAALRLSHFYSNVAGNLDEALRWAVIGAENGDAKSALTAYALLDRRTSEQDRRRAQFWLKKAAEQGYRPAIDIEGQSK